jgi:putative ABC transport system substrate-binding protein
MLDAKIDYEVEYNNRARVPQWPEHFARWAREAATYRNQAAANGLSEIGIAYGPSERAARLVQPARRRSRRDARALGVHLHAVEMRRADELDHAFAAKSHAGADALLVMESGPRFPGLRGRTVDLAAHHRLPAMYERHETVAAGGLMAYGPSIPENYRRAAAYVDKNLKGATPADLPVEQPTTFELVIKLKTAQALGLTIPPALLFQATEAIR